MTPPPRKDATLMDADVREKIHLEILKRTGAYHANDHIILPSGHHTTEYIEKTLVIPAHGPRRMVVVLCDEPVEPGALVQR